MIVSIKDSIRNNLALLTNRLALQNGNDDLKVLMCKIVEAIDKNNFNSKNR